MEAALQEAQAEELRRIEARRDESERRLAEREAEAARTRRLEARKKEEARLLAVRPPASRAGWPRPRIWPVLRPSAEQRCAFAGGDAQGDDGKGGGGAAHTWLQPGKPGGK